MKQKGHIWITKALNERQRAYVQNTGINLKEVPLSKIEFRPFPEDMPQAEAWVFTSQNAVAKLPYTSFPGTVYASGNQTAKTLKEKGFNVKSAANETALSLAETITKDGVKSAVFFCGTIHRKELPEHLTKNNIELTEVVVYQTLLTPHSIPAQKGDALFFMSPSAVDSFAKKNNFSKEFEYYSIGETTAAALRSKGVQKINTAAAASFEAMLENYTSENKRIWSFQN